MTSNLAQLLNPAQYEAATHMGGPLMIIAGAGSGKTRVITHRIAFLAREVGIPLSRIMAVTFTNKAAHEMRERVCRILDIPDDRSLPISTFHSRGAMILRREAAAAGLDRNFTILDERDQNTAVKAAMEKVGVDSKQVRPGQVAEFINLAKMKLLTPADVMAEGDEEDVAYGSLYAAYEEILARNKALDFEDLIFRTVRLFRDNETVRQQWAERYRYVLVDEYQDTNHGQFLLTHQFARDHEQVCVVGDEDQAIYSWRGADITNLIDFQKVFPKARLIRLEQNYRSTGTILKAASGLIAHNKQRIGKTLWTQGAEGDLLQGFVGSDEADEGELAARYIAGMLSSGESSADQIAVFYRSHRLSRTVEDGLRRLRVPYRIIGGVRFYDRAEIKDVLSFARLTVAPTADMAFERIINVPPRGVGAKTVGDIVSAALAEGVPALEMARRRLAEGAIKGKARGGLETILAQLDNWQEEARRLEPHYFLEKVIKDTHYREEGIGDPKSLDGKSRLENVEELLGVAREYAEEFPGSRIEGFLEAMALDAQREDKTSGPSVSLMTVHNSKGLEFDVVFILGLDQRLFPVGFALDVDNEQRENALEEERRLFYVAITRARRQVFLSRARRRMMTYGAWDDTEPSMFLAELPEDVMSRETRQRLGVGSSWRSAPPPPSPAKASPSGTFGAWSAQKPSPPPTHPYRVGDRVTHKHFGPGKVKSAGGLSGREWVEVDFDSGARERFIIRWTPLSKE